MPARQIWLFLVERDVSSLIEDLQAREPGLAASWGRYLQGDPRDLLANPSLLDHDRSARDRLGLDAVDERGVREDGSHLCFR